MAKQIARLLKTDIMADLDMPGLAQVLASKGRKGDTMLAHITPQEAALLKSRGGAGTMNPDTGLPEFYDGDADTYFPTSRAGSMGYDQDTYYAPRQQTSAVPMPVIEELPGTNASSYTGGRATTPSSQFYGDLTPPDLPTGIYQGGRLTSAYAPPDLPQSSLALELRRPDYVPQTPALAEKPPGFLQRMGERLQQPETMEKLGLAGLQALPGILASRQAAQQGREAKAEMQRLAAPYQQQGQALLAQAQRGELTAPAQQQIQALQARAAQGVAGRGGVGAEQSAAQVEAFRQQLLQGQYEMGLKVANIGDQIAAGAIRTGLSADQYVNQLTDTYFTNIARSMYGQAPQVAPVQQPR
jgi:hypothetical protein